MKLMLMVFGMAMTIGFGPEEHDVPLANYQFDVFREVITLEAQFDKKDMESAVLKEGQKQVTKEELLSYFWFNTSFFINKVETQFQLCDFRTDEEHYYLNVELPIDPTPLKELKVFTTCLVKEIADHSNILFIDQGKEETRGYRLHKGRIHTTIEF